MIDFQTIVSSVDIVDEISNYVNLKKRGSNYKGLCPFHNEKTPSFVVSSEKKIFKCFGCGVSGNIITFLVEKEAITAKEAAIYLNDKYSLQCVSNQSIKFSGANALNTALAYYRMNTKYYDYMIERGFDKETIDTFQIGFANGKFLEYARKQGINDKKLIEVGLVCKKNHINIYDRFFNRIMFPIHNQSGIIIGFTARILAADKKQPKYINSPESEIFHKSKVLYNLNRSKQYIKKKGAAYVVEGQTDVMRMWQLGIKNVVSLSGTALTLDQIKLLRNLCDQIIFVFDNDDAGAKANERSILLSLENSMIPHVVKLPQENSDPDSLGKENPDLLIKLLNNPLSVVPYIKERYDNVLQFLTTFLKSLRHHNSPITKSMFIKELSSVANINEQAILHELEYGKFHKNEKAISDTFIKDDYYEIISLIVSNPDDTEIQEIFLKLDLPEKYQDIVDAIKKNELNLITHKYSKYVDISHSSKENNLHQMKHLVSIIYVKKLEARRDFLSRSLNNLSDDDLVATLKKINEIDKKIFYLTNL